MKQLLLASENKGKLVEMRELLLGLGLELFSPYDLDLRLNVDENGSTYAENAALKALAYQRASGLATLADDSGLEVDALGGRPGLHSARFSPLPNASDADRRAYLLEQLRGKPQPWTACFHCTVAVALPGGSLEFAKGECPGVISPIERGSTGFGYDPIFYIPERGATMAELGEAVKNQISHRARAIRAARPLLEVWLSA